MRDRLRCRSRSALIAGGVLVVLFSLANPSAALVGFADVVLGYYDSGAGPLPGPYGGYYGAYSSFPIPISTSVVLGDDPGATVDFLSLPTGSWVAVGFTDETVVNGPGNDIFIRETGGNGERANVYILPVGWTSFADVQFLGIAQDDTTTSFDLASIGFTKQVQAVIIEGLDSLGGSPGFDVVNVQVLPGSIGPPVPLPPAFLLFSSGLVGLIGLRILRRS